MTAFDGLREHWEPLAITAPRRRHRRWRRVIDGILFVAAVAAMTALVVIGLRVLLG